jgi:hypothetical protein
MYPPPEWWEKNGLPIPIPEFLFHPQIKWRFDFYFPYHWVAIEIEGGAFKYGRHNRAKGFLEDMKKYNAAAELGIRLLRYPSVNKIDCDQIKRTLKI